ncbi:MAG: hypothetical protein HYY93_05020 [Planctomycetes bacterium]|nr:hypothetical protein [Planctomycetota bacterium]
MRFTTVVFRWHPRELSTLTVLVLALIVPKAVSQEIDVQGVIDRYLRMPDPGDDWGKVLRHDTVAELVSLDVRSLPALTEIARQDGRPWMKYVTLYVLGEIRHLDGLRITDEAQSERGDSRVRAAAATAAEKILQANPLPGLLQQRVALPLRPADETGVSDIDLRLLRDPSVLSTLEVQRRIAIVRDLRATMAEFPLLARLDLRRRWILEHYWKEARPSVLQELLRKDEQVYSDNVLLSVLAFKPADEIQADPELRAILFRSCEAREPTLRLLALFGLAGVSNDAAVSRIRRASLEDSNAAVRRAAQRLVAEGKKGDLQAFLKDYAQVSELQVGMRVLAQRQSAPVAETSDPTKLQSTSRAGGEAEGRNIPISGRDTPIRPERHVFSEKQDGPTPNLPTSETSPATWDHVPPFSSLGFVVAGVAIVLVICRRCLR